ncbi:ketosteroid isomerase-like protein [Pseudochelatococcus lubricantis]|uniref:Ketosteroid isomerase-like protein n=2 Tax=Pseudochelatococcus lubricantis TaxID=1538102 RepID=A0ABX0V129_9HYPH|nr:ketosteroid isomerase-like protein [Pseudochelatococcus lubricantis]
MMSVRETVEAFWKGHSAGDRAALKQIVSEDLIWTVVGGTSPIAKTYRGWDGFFGELLDGLAQAFWPGTLDMQLKGLYADEEKGVGILQLEESATLRNGNTVKLEIVDVMTVRGGKVVEVREVMDLAAVNKAFGF